MWKCALCLVVLTLTLKSLMIHIRETHGSNPNFSLFCGINGCPRNFNKYDTFYRHVKKAHRDLYESSVFHNPQFVQEQEINTAAFDSIEQMHGAGLPGSMVNEGGDAQGTMDDNSSTVSFEETMDTVDEIVLETPDRSQQEAQFLLGLKEKRHITQAALDDVRDGCRMAIRNAIQDFSKDIKQRIISNPNITAEQDKVFDSIDESIEMFDEPFGKLSSKYMQDKYMERNMDFVPFQEIILGEKGMYVIKNNKRELILKDRKFYYIPIMKSIEQMLQNKRIRNMVTRQRQQVPNEMFIDIWDGAHIKNSLDMNSPNTLYIEVYYDDVEVCDPLGSRSRNMAMFYFRLGNIDVLFRSKVAAIKLWAVVETKFLKQYGMDSVIRPLVDDLKIMGTAGWYMEFEGERLHFYGFLGAVLGDTPATNAMLGFKEGVNFAFDKCRLCQCLNYKMQVCFKEENFTMLNHRNYLIKCSRIENACNARMQQKLSTLYGINRQSLFVECPNFDICMNTPLDIMHIMMEGIVPYEVKQLLFHCILQEDMFSLSNFTNVSENYFSNFRYDSMSRPTPISITTLNSNDNSLRQSSDQMHVLLRALPFILASLISVTTVEFDFIKNLLQITNILFSSVISLGTCSILADFIEEHLKTFKNLFPEANILPKQHFLLHFPNLIKKIGPPTRHSASRFESKNKCFSRRVKVQQNFKNVAYTMASAAQRESCLANDVENENQHPMFGNEFETGKTFDFENLNYLKNKLEIFQGIDKSCVNFAHYGKTLKLGGEKFVKDYTYLAVEVENNVVKFGLLKNIFFVNGTEIFFEVQLFDTHFSENFQSFILEIAEPEMPCATILVKPANLLDFHAYSLYEFNEEFYLQVPYDLFGVIELAEEGCQHLHNHLGEINK